MPQITSSDKISAITTGGQLLATIRDRLVDEIRPGAIPLEIDNLAKKLIYQVGGKPSFLTVTGYHWATCFSINSGVVHGIPTREPIHEGDKVGLDIGLYYKGFHTDTAWTKLVQSSLPCRQAGKFKVNNTIDKFLDTGKLALDRAIGQAQPGNRIGHISQAIGQTVQQAGYSVVKTLVGHGVGKKLHEPPQIPGVLTHPLEKTPQLRIGMVIAIEVIYNMGRSEITYKNEDGWSLVTADGSLSGLFEHTVYISEKGPVILTQSQK